jgi:hypothetical protein
MADPLINDASPKGLLRQRNIFLSCSILSLASIAFALPHRITQFRQRRHLDERLVNLQAQIVAKQLEITGLEKLIKAAQQEIRTNLSK